MTSIENLATQWKHIILVNYIIGIVQGMHVSPGDVSEEPMTQEMRKKGWRMSCDAGEETEGLENQL